MKYLFPTLHFLISTSIKNSYEKFKAKIYWVIVPESILINFSASIFPPEITQTIFPVPDFPVNAAASEEPPATNAIEV